MILHVELLGFGGPFRLTTNQTDTESDVLALLWDGEPPDGTQLTLVDQQLGYNKFDLTGVHNEQATHLLPAAADWLTEASAQTYEDSLAAPALDQQRHDEYMAQVVPHLGGVTVGEIFNNFDAWKGLRESDGWFVWVGFDEHEGGSAIELWELPTEEQVRNDIRLYVAQGSSLNQAVRQTIQEGFDELKLIVLRLAVAGSG